RWCVVGVTLTAALVGALLVLPARALYRTTSVVGHDPSAQSANERVDFVADMRAAMFQPSVLDQVSEAVGVSADELEDSLTVRRVNDSNLIRVIYETTARDEDTARQIVSLAPTAALEFLKQG